MIVRILILLTSVGLAAQDYSYRQYSVAAGLPDARVEQVVADTQGYVYARTPLGWVRFDGERFEDIARLPEAASDDIWMSGRELEGIHTRYLAGTPFAGTQLLDLAEDAEGRRWLATSDAGLLRQLPSSFMTYPVGGGGVTALTENRDTLWIGTDGRGLFRLTADRAPEPVDIGTSLEGIRITSLVADTSFLYIGTAGRGLFAVNGDTLLHLRQAGGLPSNWIREMIVADSSVMVLTTAGDLVGLYATDTNLIVRPHHISVIPDVKFTHLLRGPGGRPILTAPREKRHLWKAESASVVSGLPEVRSAALRRGSQLWLGVDDKGLYYTDLEAEPFRFGRVDDRLTGGSPHFSALLALDSEREVWAGNGQGVVRITLDGSGQPLFSRQYGAAEGWGDDDSGPEVIFGTAAGAIWFGTKLGLVRFTGASADTYRSPPSTRLEAITLFYDTITPGRIHFSARENHLGFRFRAVDLSYPERIRYRYRLSPIAPEWSPMTSETTVRYAGLPGGAYTFSVAASTDGGKTWGDPATYNFEVESPLVLQPWFSIGGVLLLAGFLIGGFYAYHLRLLRRQASERAALKRENDVLRLEQQARQLQMNPHFIFNALNGIRGLVDDREAREQLSRFATLMRSILHNSRQEYITLAEELATLDRYLRMEQFCHAEPFAYHLEPPEGVDPEEISLPPMLIQPFVENAILHGFAGLDRPGELHVRFLLRGRRCSVYIEDNGVGREEARKRREKGSPGHQPVALSVTSDRISAMGGKLIISNGNPHGTVIHLEIPVTYAW